MSHSYQSSPTETANLINEIRESGIKHSPDQIVRIAKTKDGQIIFLETGDFRSGLQHIIENHLSQFADFNISETEIADAVILAVLNGTIVGYQSQNRPIYELQFNQQTVYIAVTVSSNGYIVCANPRSGP